MLILDEKLTNIAYTAYKKTYFYSKICDIDSLVSFEALPIICGQDIKNQTVSLLAQRMLDAPYYGETAIINRYFAKEEINNLTLRWQKRLEGSKRVLCLLDKVLYPYLAIFNDLNLYIYPIASFSSCRKVVEIIKKNSIDTIIGNSNKVLTLAQYVMNCAEKINIEKCFVFFDHYIEDVALRINRYLSVQCVCIKVISEILVELGEVGTLLVLNDNIYPEIVETNGDKVLPYGQYGELVITLLDNTIQPIVRFSTGHKTRMISENALDCKSYNIDNLTVQLEEFIFMIEQVVDYKIENLKTRLMVTLVTLDDLAFPIERIENEIRKIFDDENVILHIKKVGDYVL